VITLHSTATTAQFFADSGYTGHFVGDGWGESQTISNDTDGNFSTIISRSGDLLLVTGDGGGVGFLPWGTYNNIPPIRETTVVNALGTFVSQATISVIFDSNEEFIENASVVTDTFETTSATTTEVTFYSTQLTTTQRADASVIYTSTRQTQTDEAVWSTQLSGTSTVFVSTRSRNTTTTQPSAGNAFVQTWTESTLLSTLSGNEALVTISTEGANTILATASTTAAVTFDGNTVESFSLSDAVVPVTSIYGSASMREPQGEVFTPGNIILDLFGWTVQPVTAQILNTATTSFAITQTTSTQVDEGRITIDSGSLPLPTSENVVTTTVSSVQGTTVESLQTTVLGLETKSYTWENKTKMSFFFGETTKWTGSASSEANVSYDLTSPNDIGWSGIYSNGATLQFNGFNNEPYTVTVYLTSSLPFTSLSKTGSSIASIIGENNLTKFNKNRVGVRAGANFAGSVDFTYEEGSFSAAHITPEIGEIISGTARAGDSYYTIYRDSMTVRPTSGGETSQSQLPLSGAAQSYWVDAQNNAVIAPVASPATDFMAGGGLPLASQQSGYAFLPRGAYITGQGASTGSTSFTNNTVLVWANTAEITMFRPATVWTSTEAAFVGATSFLRNGILADQPIDD
jgi:hypothetical protein